MVLVATMTTPLLPMMVVETVRVDASTISNAPNATLVAAIETVLVSLMTISADAYLTPSTAMADVPVMLAAPIA
jgi:hypothetical protein